MPIVLSILCLIFSYFFLTEWVFLHREFLLPLYIARITLILFSSGFLLLSVKKIFKNYPDSQKTKGLFVFIFVLVSLFNIIEMAFMFIPKSQGPGMAYASKIWFWYYWKTNTDGFREIELSAIDSKRKKILFIGDSYTAGHGIRHVNDRVSNLIQKQLPANYQCINLGMNGFNTPNERKLVEHLPARPDITVICHVLNDADHLLSRPGNYFGRQYNAQDRFEKSLEFAGKRSFVFNYLYWHYKAHQNFVQVTKEIIPTGAEQALMDIYKPFNNDSLLAIHARDLQFMYHHLTDANKKCIVLLYPDLYDIVLHTHVMTANQRLYNALEASGIPCLDLSRLALRLPEKDRMVNNMDAHPGPEMNKIFADSLYRHLQILGWVN